MTSIERAVDELQQISQISQGSVVFGCSHLPAFSVVPSLINQFQVENPSATITIIEGQLSELIASIRLGRLDFFIGIASPEISMAEFFIDKSIKAEFCIISRKGHPLENSQSLSQLQGAKWYFPHSKTGYYNDLERLIFPVGRGNGDTVIYGDSMTIGEQLVMNEDYLFIGPKAMLNVEHLQGTISMVPVKEKLIPCSTNNNKV